MFIRFLVFLFCFITATIMAQDTIVELSGKIIPSQVLEITSSEIKYKKFDNMSGPVYTISKSAVESIKFQNGSSEIITNKESLAGAKVYLFRKTGYHGGLIPFNVFLDDKLLCQLNTGKYSVHEIPNGVHSFSVQYGGRSSKKSAEKLEVKMLPNMTYYVEVDQKNTAIAPDVFCIEIDKTRAEALLNKCKEDMECIKQ